MSKAGLLPLLYTIVIEVQSALTPGSSKLTSKLEPRAVDDSQGGEHMTGAPRAQAKNQWLLPESGDRAACLLR